MTGLDPCTWVRLDHGIINRTNPRRINQPALGLNKMRIDRGRVRLMGGIAWGEEQPQQFCNINNLENILNFFSNDITFATFTLRKRIGIDYLVYVRRLNDLKLN